MLMLLSPGLNGRRNNFMKKIKLNFLVFLVIWVISIIFGLLYWHYIRQLRGRMPFLVDILFPFYCILSSIPVFLKIESSFIKRFYFIFLSINSLIGVAAYIKFYNSGPLGFTFAPLLLFLTYMVLLFITLFLIIIRLIWDKIKVLRMS